MADDAMTEEGVAVAADATARAATDAPARPQRASSPVRIPSLVRASSSSALSDAADACAEPRAASFSSVEAASARLRRGPSLKIFLPSDDLALKAILSPPTGRREPGSAPDDGLRLEKSASASAIVTTATANLLDKLLFRASDAAATAATASGPVNSADSLEPRAKSSTGSLAEEELASSAAADSAAVLNTSLPPPPFANMFACDACRADIGSLLGKGRHHCRNCGGSFCADCSARVAVVPFLAYLDRGAQRVCDACFHRIRNFQAQVRSEQVTWGGLPPPPADALRRAFRLPEDEAPVSVFNCSLFLDITPFYGHLLLTRKHACFLPYVARKDLPAASAPASAGDNVDVSSSYSVPSTPHGPPRALKLPYERIVSLVKPQFYYINGLQVKTDAKHKFFLAEFNGLRDMCFLRLDQLIRARQQQPASPRGGGSGGGGGDGRAQSSGEPARPSAQDLLQQAMERRKSYRKLVAEQQSAAGAPASSSGSFSTSASASAPVSVMLTPPVDASDMLNFASQQSSVGFFDIDDADTRGSGEFTTSTGDMTAGDDEERAESKRQREKREQCEGGADEDEEDEDGAASLANCSSSSSDDESFEPLPPDELLARTTILLDCELRADVKQVFDLLWNDDVGRGFTVANLERARDVDISVSKWRAIGEHEREEVARGAVVSTERDYAMVRHVASKHPPKTSFPGLPAYADCQHTQRFRLDASSQGGDRWERFVVSDVMRMRQIPFADYFEIESRWVFSRDGSKYCHVQVGLLVNFLKATWFKSQITSSTKSESKEAYENWAKQAIEHLEAHQERIASVPKPPRQPALASARKRVRILSPAVKQPSGDLSRAPSAGSDSVIASAWTTAAPSVRSDADDDGVVSDLRGLLSLLASSAYTQWVVLALLLYCLLVIRSQQVQLEHLTSTTAALLEKLQQSGRAALEHPAAPDAVALHGACEQQVLDGARRALEKYFHGAGASR